MIEGGSLFTFTELGIVIIIAAIAAFFLRLIKQPQILAYIIVGVLITPVFHWITDTTVIESMSAIGIAFLLFIVGMEIDLKSLKNVAFITSFGSTIQIVILFILGYLVGLMLGYVSIEAAYIGLMLCFSSTMIVMKLLSDNRELNTLHGRIVIGTLLVEDIVAILALSVLSSINHFSIVLLSYSLIKFISMFLVAYFAGKFVFPPIFRYAAENQELLLISSLAVCFIFSLTFYYLGFSIAIGAFIAGVTLGNLEYNLEIIGKIRSLRDFFAVLFFVSLGMGLSLAVIQRMWLPFIILTLTIIILKPLIIMTICSLFKYTKKPAFSTAISLAQTGEFALIVAAQGLVLGHITQDLFSLIVMITLFTITLTSYFIKYDHILYKALEKPLKIFDVFTTEGLEYLPSQTKPSIILCGHNRIGYSILRDLKDVKKKVLVIDYNPEVIAKMVKDGYHCIYGEVTDEEIIERMNPTHINILISTVPDINDSTFLIKKIRAVNKKAKIFVTASDIEDAILLYNYGANYVILPHFLGGEHVANLITNVRNNKVNLDDEKKRHLDNLSERINLGQEHPKHI